MREEDSLIKKLLDIKNKLRIEKPLIHCITNHITINDCANAVLALGGKPIMAENQREVSDITASAKALAVNLGNISDSRIVSMMISGEVANKNNIPAIIDIVGVNCSILRLNFALEFIEKCRPKVIKGNMSEVKAVFGISTNSKGVDVSDEDNTNEKTISYNIKLVKDLASKTNSIVVATGEMDLISNGKETYVIENGCIELSKITGTGCMLNALIATCISSGDLLEGAILGTLIMGISGEFSKNAKGIASFKIDLLDYISIIKDNDIIEKFKIRVVK